MAAPETRIVKQCVEKMPPRKDPNDPKEIITKIAKVKPPKGMIYHAVEGPKVPAYFLYPEELRHSKRIAVLRDFLLKQVQA